MGGAEKLVVDMLPRLRDKGCDVELLTLSGKKTPLYNTLEQTGVKIHHFGEQTRVYDPRNILRMVFFLKKHHYDIVHTHNTASQMFAAVAGVLCSVVLCTTEHNTSNRRRDWKWYKPVDRWMYRQYKKVICISDSTESNLRNFIGDWSDKVCTIYNGIDVELYAHALPLEKIKITPPRKVVAMVAGFRYQKDQETVIRSLRHLPDNVELWLVGDGSRRSVVEQCIIDCALEDRVRLLGVRRDVPAILKSVDVVVQSSHWEGFGLAAAEAMAAGKPVVASNVEGLSQVVEGAGLLFPLGDDKALSDIIGHLLSDSNFYASVAQKCQQRAREFDISKTVDSYLAVYNEIIKKKES